MLHLVLIPILGALLILKCGVMKKQTSHETTTASERKNKSIVMERMPRSVGSTEAKKTISVEDEVREKLEALDKNHECEKKKKKCYCEDYITSLEALRQKSVSAELDQEIKKRLEKTDGYWVVTKTGKQHRKLYMREEGTQISEVKKKNKSKEKIDKTKTKTKTKKKQPATKRPSTENMDSDFTSMHQNPMDGQTEVGEYEHLIPPEKEIIVTLETQHSELSGGE